MESLLILGSSFLVGAWLRSKREGKKNGKSTITVILAGQSNMAGRGGLQPKEGGGWLWNVESLTPLEASLATPGPYGEKIMRFSAKNTWEPAREPLHYDIDTKKTCGVGPGLVFARCVLEHSGREVYLIPCAVGGSKLEDWMPGCSLYVQMQSRVVAASMPIDVLIWYQGESEGLNEIEAHSFYDKTSSLIDSFRENFGRSVIIVLVALAGTREKLPYIDIVHEAQLRIAREDSRIVLVNAAGGALRSDQLHLTTDAAVRLGERLALKVLERLGDSDAVLQAVRSS